MIFRSLLLTTGSRALDGAVRFLTVPIVLGYFGREQFGLIALAFSMQVFLTIADYGVSVNAVRRLADLFQRREADEVTRLAHAATFYYLLVGVANFAVVLVIALMAPRWFDLQPHQAQAFFWMMLSLGVSTVLTWLFSIYRQILQAAGQVGWDEAVNLVATAGTAVVVALTVWLRLPPEVYFALVLAPPLVPMWLRLRRARQLVPGLRAGLRIDWIRFKPMVGTSLWLFALTLAEMLANHYRPVILAQQTDLGTVADFRILQQVAGFATLMMTGLMSVLYPAMARLDAAQQHDRIATAIRSGSRLLLWAHIGVLVPLAALTPMLLQIYVGADFTRLAPALAIWMLTLLVYHNAMLSSLVIARGKLAFIATSAVVNTLVSLTAAYALAPSLGILAVVWTYAAYVAVQLAVLYLVAVPAAGGGGGWQLVRHVVPRPLASALLALAAAWTAVAFTGLGLWLGALVFAVAFSLLAWWPGGALDDYRLLRRPVREAI